MAELRPRKAFAEEAEGSQAPIACARRGVKIGGAADLCLIAAKAAAAAATAREGPGSIVGATTLGALYGFLGASGGKAADAFRGRVLDGRFRLVGGSMGAVLARSAMGSPRRSLARGE